MNWSVSMRPVLAVLRPNLRRARQMAPDAASGCAPQKPKERAAGREVREGGAARPVALRPWYDDSPGTPGFGFRGLLWRSLVIVADIAVLRPTSGPGVIQVRVVGTDRPPSPRLWRAGRAVRTSRWLGASGRRALPLDSMHRPRERDGRQKA
jgi:hypothetical protein